MSYDDEYSNLDTAVPAHGTRWGRRIVLGVVAFLLISVVLIGLGRAFVFGVYYLPSATMEPSLEIGDRILVNRLDRSPERGDVIVYRQADGLDVVKRVIAVGGDTIAVRGGELFIDDEVVDESYLGADTVTDDVDPVTVPVGSLFVMGDNRRESYDSRFSGPILLEDVVGTVVGT